MGDQDPARREPSLPGSTAQGDQSPAGLFETRTGHFKFESGHHGDRWLDLESLFLQPSRTRNAVRRLAGRLEANKFDAVCGPLNEGAFIALMIAGELDRDFTYTERIERPTQDDRRELYPVDYRLPGTLRKRVSGLRVAIINDVINAGSSVRGALFDLIECGAKATCLAALLTLGSSAFDFAAEHELKLISLGHLPSFVESGRMPAVRRWRPTR